MSNAGNFLKNVGQAIVIYILLNFIFLLLFALVGGVVVDGASVKFGAFWAVLVKEDIGGLIVTLLGPSGGSHADTIYSGVLYFVNDLISSYGQRTNATSWNIFGILWTILPGTITAIIMGKFFCNEQPSKAFSTVMTTVVILTLLPILIAVIGAIPGSLGLTNALVPQMYWTSTAADVVIWRPPESYLKILFAGLFNGIIYGAFAMKSSTSL